MVTGRNRAIDRLRRDRVLAEKTRLLDQAQSAEIPHDETTIPDERLELVSCAVIRHWRQRPRSR